jgi:hypothetical protein
MFVMFATRSLETELSAGHCIPPRESATTAGRRSRGGQPSARALPGRLVPRSGPPI